VSTKAVKNFVNSDPQLVRMSITFMFLFYTEMNPNKCPTGTVLLFWIWFFFQLIKEFGT